MINNKNINIITRIDSDLINEKGILKPFTEQLLEFEYGIKEYTKPFVISANNKKLEYANTKDNPIIINLSTIQKLKHKHNIDLKFLLKLDDLIQNSIFAFDSIQHESSKIFVLSEKNSKGNNIIFILRDDSQYNKMEINEITSVYDKKNLQNLIEKTKIMGGNFYLNPEKIQEYKIMGYSTPLDNDKELNIETEIDRENECDGWESKKETDYER